MIDKDGDRFKDGCQMGSLVFQGFDDGKEFSFINVVISFYEYKGGGVVCNGIMGWFSCFKV